MLKLFYFKQFSLVLFDPYIGPYLVLPLWARVDLGALLNLTTRLFSVITRILVWGKSYLFAADREKMFLCRLILYVKTA